jgi:hypothetical protein
MTTSPAGVTCDPNAEKCFFDPDDRSPHMRVAVPWPRLDVDEAGLHRMRRAEVVGDAVVPMRGVR